MNCQSIIQNSGERLTHTDDSNSEVFVWESPAGFNVGDVARKIKLTTVRRGMETTYKAAIPLAAIGASMAKLQNGVRFNLLVNDDDGEGREGWIHLAPGLGSGKNPAQFPFVVFR